MYTKIARLAVVPLLLAFGVFAYMNHRLRATECPDCTPLPPPHPTAPARSAADTASIKKAFEEIYDKGTWGKNAAGVGTSGTGSTDHATAVYRTFLQQFLKDHNIHSVVDAGCGDWEFSQTMDWTGIDYKGYDIVPKVIEADTQRFAKPGIQFFNADIVATDLPPADLLISKHVLQHLPTSSVQQFLKQLPKYRHVLFVNGVDRITLTGDNTDIAPGGYRTLDVTAPPFDLVGLKILTYEGEARLMHQVVHIMPPH